MPRPEPLGWKLLTLILPIILTSILGFIVFKMQSNINSRLTLTQDYYRKRLEVYGKLYDNLVVVRERAQRALNEPIDIGRPGRHGGGVQPELLRKHHLPHSAPSVRRGEHVEHLDQRYSGSHPSHRSR